MIFILAKNEREFRHFIHYNKLNIKYFSYISNIDKIRGIKGFPFIKLPGWFYARLDPNEKITEEIEQCLLIAEAVDLKQVFFDYFKKFDR